MPCLMGRDTSSTLQRMRSSPTNACNIGNIEPFELSVLIQEGDNHGNVVEEGLQDLLLFLAGLLASAALGHIPKDEHHSGQAARFVADGGAAVIDVVFG